MNVTPVAFGAVIDHGINAEAVADAHVASTPGALKLKIGFRPKENRPDDFRFLTVDGTQQEVPFLTRMRDIWNGFLKDPDRQDPGVQRGIRKTPRVIWRWVSQQAGLSGMEAGRFDPASLDITG